MPVGSVMLPAARASSGRSVQWLRHTRRDLHVCVQCRRHVDHRPWCSAGIAHGHARAVGARRHRLQSGWHTSAASIHPSLASGAESCWKRSWVYTSRPSTSTDPHRSLTGTRPRASSVSPSSRGIAELRRPHRWRPVAQAKQPKHHGEPRSRSTRGKAHAGRRDSANAKHHQADVHVRHTAQARLSRKRV